MYYIIMIVHKFPETVDEVIFYEEQIVIENLYNYLRRAGYGFNKKQMSKSLRAKFRVDEVTNYGYGGHQLVKMNAVYSSTKNTEDNQFSEATPSGSLEMIISAKGAIDWLKRGVKYILTFTEAEDQE
jgi:hypothetical protein